ncbi:MAG: O-antigen ligase family protein [Patescibacteria group bacterium]
MLDKLKTAPALLSLSIITIFLALLWLFAAWPVLLKLLFSLALYILALSFFAPRAGFFLFIFLRPILDFSTSYKLINFSSWSLNLASLYSLIFIIFALYLYLGGHFSFSKLGGKKVLFFWSAFIFWSLASLLWSFAPSSSLVELARLASFLAAFILGLGLIRNNQDLTDLIKVIIFSAFIPVAVALWQLASYSGLIEGNQNRLFGTFAHPNMLAFFLTLIITLAVFIGLNLKKDRVEMYWYWLLALIFTITLFFTYTRGAYLVLLAIVFIVGALKFRKFLFVALAFIFLLYLSSNTISGRFNSIFQSDPYGSISWRISLWRDELSYIKREPLLGYGSGLASTVIAQNRDWRLGSNEPHNDFLRVAIDSGLIGLSLYLLLIISLLWQLKDNYFRTSAPRLKMINLFVLALGLALYALSFGDNILNDSALQWSWWALLGGLIAVQAKKADQAA